MATILQKCVLATVGMLVVTRRKIPTHRSPVLLHSKNSVFKTSESPSSSQPLSAIAERPDVSGGDDSEEEEDEEGGWKTPTPAPYNTSKDEGVLKAGYLWKKGERRKVMLFV